MRPIMATVAIAVLLAAGIGAWQTPASTGAISGVVKDGVTGQALSGVIVELRAPSTGAPLARLTRQVTDSRGRFVFRALAAGAGYALQATRPGFVNGAYGQSVMFGPSGHITLKDGEWFPSADILLWKPGAIAGRVLDEANEPVVGVYVRALSRVTLAGATQLLAGPVARTDDRGDYRIAGLAPGDYVVFVPSPALSVSEDAPAGVLGKPAVPPRMDLFSMMPTQPRTDALLDPVGGHRLVLGNHVTPPAAADGRARTYGLAFHPAVGSVESSTAVTLALGEERGGVDILLRPVPAVHVFGRVVGPPEALSGLMLRLVPAGLEGLSNGAETATSLVRADGSFAFLQVPAGDYVIDAPSTTLEFTMTSAGVSDVLPAPPGMRWTGSQSGTLAAGPPGAGFVRQSGPRTDSYWVRTPLSVGADDLRDVVVSLQPSITLRGRLEYEGTTQVTVEQTPVGGISAGGGNRAVTTSTTPRPSTQPFIIAEPAFAVASLGMPRTERPPAEAPQDHLAISGLRLGEYVIRVTSGADRYIVRSVTVDGVDYTRKPLDTANLTPTSELVITLTDKLIELRGVVTDERGSATEGVVLAFPVERAEWRGYGLTPQRLKAVPLSGAPGFELRGLPAGEYFIVAVPAAQTLAWQDPAFLARAAGVATRISLNWGDSRQVDLRLVRVP